MADKCPLLSFARICSVSTLEEDSSGGVAPNCSNYSKFETVFPTDLQIAREFRRLYQRVPKTIVGHIHDPTATLNPIHEYLSTAESV